MPGILDLFRRHSAERVIEEKPEIPKEDLFKLLSIFYTFNHGDKACQPIEYEYFAGSKENGSFDFATLKRKFHEVGYFIDRVVCVSDEPHSPDFVPYIPNEKEYEKRRKNSDYLPIDISYLIVSNLSGTQYIIEESIDSLEFLARCGDERARKTYNEWIEYKDEIMSYYSRCPSRKDEDGKAKVKKRN